MQPGVEKGLRTLLLGTRLNVLLPLGFVALIGRAAHWGQGSTFTCALLALCPLAERLGWATEQLSEHTGQTVGGLLNATFGNATELIVSALAIKNGLLRVVQLSLLGSVLSNLLLVLGCAFFFGGLKYKQQRFSRGGVAANSTLLILGSVALMLPAMLSATATELHAEEDSLWLSRVSSLCLLGIYAAFIYFQLRTHSFLFETHQEDISRLQGVSIELGAAQSPSGGGGAFDEREPDSAASSRGGRVTVAEEEEDEDEEVVLSFWGAIWCLAALTIAISVLSDIIVETIEGAKPHHHHISPPPHPTIPPPPELPVPPALPGARANLSLSRRRRGGLLRHARRLRLHHPAPHRRQRRRGAPAPPNPPLPPSPPDAVVFTCHSTPPPCSSR